MIFPEMTRNYDEVCVNRNHLIAGLAGLALLCILNMAGIGNLLFREMNKPSPASKRVLVTELTYCNSNDIKPCIVSFRLDTDNNMLVDILTLDSAYPDFYLKINNAYEENLYRCQPEEDAPLNVDCIGREMYPGESLHFVLISSSDERVLAEGNFAIIGLLLATPGGGATETATPTETSEPASELTDAPPTPPLLIIPTPTRSIPLTITPSYPNPSSYP